MEKRKQKTCLFGTDPNKLFSLQTVFQWKWKLWWLFPLIADYRAIKTSVSIIIWFFWPYHAALIASNHFLSIRVSYVIQTALVMITKLLKMIKSHHNCLNCFEVLDLPKQVSNTQRHLALRPNETKESNKSPHLRRWNQQMFATVAEKNDSNAQSSHRFSSASSRNNFAPASSFTCQTSSLIYKALILMFRLNQLWNLFESDTTLTRGDFSIVILQMQQRHCSNAVSFAFFEVSYVYMTVRLYVCVCVTVLLHNSATHVFCCIENITESNSLLWEINMCVVIHIWADVREAVSCLTMRWLRTHAISVFL